MVTLALIAHVFIGLLGVGASYVVVMQLLRSHIPLAWLQWTSVIAFTSYVLSWITGGFYYVVRYGSEVKPVIKAGPYPWAHSIVTESKEHIFLFLPFLAFLTMIVALFFGSELQENRKLRRAVIGIGIVTFFLGVLIAVAGVIMSGSVQ